MIADKESTTIEILGIFMQWSLWNNTYLGFWAFLLQVSYAKLNKLLAGELISWLKATDANVNMQLQATKN